MRAVAASLGRMPCCRAPGEGTAAPRFSSSELDGALFATEWAYRVQVASNVTSAGGILLFHPPYYS